MNKKWMSRGEGIQVRQRCSLSENSSEPMLLLIVIQSSGTVPKIRIYYPEKGDTYEKIGAKT